MPEFTPLEQRTLQVAKRFVGQREATGHNDGWLPRLVQRFIAAGARWLDDQPWCAAFVVYCVHTAATELGQRSILPRTASSQALFNWYEVHKVRMFHPAPGCIGLLRGGRTGHKHTFLVHEVQGTEVITIEGNFRNAVGWGHRRITDADYGPIC